MLIHSFIMIPTAFAILAMFQREVDECQDDWLHFNFISNIFIYFREMNLRMVQVTLISCAFLSIASALYITNHCKFNRKKYKKVVKMFPGDEAQVVSKSPCDENSECPTWVGYKIVNMKFKYFCKSMIIDWQVWILRRHWDLFQQYRPFQNWSDTIHWSASSLSL